MVTTSKKINLEQLDNELGGQGLSADFTDMNKKNIIPTENSNVTEEELKGAIASHIAQPTEQELRTLNRQEGIAKLKELGFTDDQITALLS